MVRRRTNHNFRLVQVITGEMMVPTRGVGEAMAIMQGTIMVSSHHLSSNMMCSTHFFIPSSELTAKTKEISADNYGGRGGGGYDRRDNHGGGGGGGGYGNRDSYGETILL